MTDTIVALATPPASSPRAVIRLSGPDTLMVVSQVFRPLADVIPSEARDLEVVPAFHWIEGTVSWSSRARVRAPAGFVLMRAPRSYTREEMAELHVVGNPMVARGVVERLVAAGARQASPGEFTRRAFVNGRISLAQAGAVLGLIDAERGEDHRLALAQLRGQQRDRISGFRDRVAGLLALLEGSLDFSEEGIDFFASSSLAARLEGLMEDGKSLWESPETAPVERAEPSLLLVGKANAGKSTLFNRLVGSKRHLVSVQPGTTRDLLTAPARFGSVAVLLVDTPGISPKSSGLGLEAAGLPAEALAQAGQKAIDRALARSAFVLFVADGSRPWEPEDEALYERIRKRPHRIVVNKSDLPTVLLSPGRGELSRVSAKTGEGVEPLKRMIGEWIAASRSADPLAGRTAERSALAGVREALARALQDARAGMSHDVIALSLREAVGAFGGLYGAFASEELLDRIFSRFCIGK